MKILKNTTLSAIDLVGLGVTVPASSSFTVVVEDYILLSSEVSLTELDPLITAGTIVVNDGLVDLNATDGKRYIRFPEAANQLRFDNSTNGFVSKNIQSAIEESKTIDSLSAHANSSITTTSTSFVTTGLELTLTAGTWVLISSATTTVSVSGVNNRGEMALFNNGTVIPDTEHEFGIRLSGISLASAGVYDEVTCVARITVTGGNLIQLGYRRVTGSTVGVTQRYLIALRVL